MKAVPARWTGVLLIVALLLLWEFVTQSGIIRSPSLPPVSHIFAVWYSLIVSSEIRRELGPSLLRLGVGYGCAVIVGVSVGLAMGYYPAIYGLLEPLTELLRPIPSPAYIPLAILFLGLGNEMKYFVIFFACLFPILLNTQTGVRGIDAVQIERKIILPGATPSILTGMRISLGIALVVVSEMVASSNGSATSFSTNNASST